jgi:hypothetical protein
VALSSISSTRVLLVLVGLPAGKSFLANKLHAFLSWRGVASKTFNVRAEAGGPRPTASGRTRPSLRPTTRGPRR